jgi:hypothetical protein
MLIKLISARLKKFLGNLSSLSLLKVLVFAGLLGLVIFIFSQKIDLTVSDLGRHLTNGRIVWNNPDILFHNAYSYTEPDFNFINHHWLYGVIIYAVYNLFGFTGLSVFNILIILAAFCLAFALARRKINAAGISLWGQIKLDGFYFSSLLSIPVILLLSERVEVRPEIFSYLFIVVTYALLEIAETSGKYRRLWFLLPLFILWANIHIYFFIGLALVGFKVLEIIIKAWREGKGGRARVPLIIFFGSIAACLINPNTWRGLVYPLNIFKNYGYEIAENKTVFFLENLMVNNNFFIFKIVLALLALSWIIYFFVAKLREPSKKYCLLIALETRLSDILFSLFISGLALLSSRNISLFGLISLIIISANLAPGLAYLQKKNTERLNLWSRFFTSPFSKIHSYVLAALLLLIIAAFFYVLDDSYRRHNIIKNSLGLGLYLGNEDSAAFFKEHHLSGPLFNNYDIGSALIFWLSGQEKVFVDNRPEAYSASFFNDVYKPMQLNKDSWEKYSREYDLKTIYFAYSDGTPWAQQFLARILRDDKWRLVYFDAYTVILINSEKYSAAEVQVLSLDSEAVRGRIRTLAAGADWKTGLSLANLAQLAGWPGVAQEIYQKILFSLPNQAQTLYCLAGLYTGYNSRTGLEISLDYYQRALAAGWRLPEVYNQMGLDYWSLGRYQEAENSWQAALRRERKNVSALYYLKQTAELKKTGKLPVD